MPGVSSSPQLDVPTSNFHGASVGKRLRLQSLPFCRCYGTGHIEIGNNVTILNKLFQNTAGISHKTVLIADDGASLRSAMMSASPARSLMLETRSQSATDACSEQTVACSPATTIRCTPSIDIIGQRPFEPHRSHSKATLARRERDHSQGSHVRA